MGVQNFLRGEGGLARIRASGIKYISARSREREISRRIHSDDFMEKRFDRFSIGIGDAELRCRFSSVRSGA